MLKRGGRVSLSLRRASFILPVWTFCVLWLATWWLEPARVNFLPLFIPLTFAIFYEFIVLPSVFLYFVFRAKMPRRRIAPKHKKVAIISPCVPSQESLEIVEKQLQAMPQITYPHDSWILDEGNSPRVKALAKKYGVKYFSRRGIKKYNQLLPPFKKKTKAGNINAWLDHVKRRQYEYFVQFDIDHLANPDYLHKTLGYFRDEKVGWVQAPSIYKNRTSWIARGSAEQELILQGPLQMGFYGHSETPFIIGSHCTYRTSAILEIGGFQPTRAEDHLDTVAMASIGYKGVFVPQIIAYGDGPESLNTYLAQQFAWAYSMFQVLLQFSPKLLLTMPARKKWQFVFAQTWYPLWSLSYLIMFCTPIVALLIKQNVARMNGIDFIIHFAPIFIGSFLVWWAARPIMQPHELGLSWRGMILHVVRWPVVLKAVIYAGLRIKRAYMITPKGRFAQQIPTLRTYHLFLFFGLASALSALLASLMYGKEVLEGQIVFALSNAIVMLTVCLVDLNLTFREIKREVPHLKRYLVKPAAAIMSLALMTMLAAISSPLVSNEISVISSQEKSAKPTLSHAITPIDTKLEILNQLKRLPVSKDDPEIVPSLGVYNDPKLKVVEPLSTPHIDHIFVNWDEPDYLAARLLQSYRLGNTPLITIEPRGNADGADLLTKISDGSYDKKLQKIVDTLSASKKTAYIRFAHEAELADLYPWSGQDPALYIGAYRHVVSYAKVHKATNLKWVWSPAGNVGAEAYYPGDDAVDIVGTTILYDQYWYGDIHPSFYQIAQTRQWLTQFNKPVWIVEFGVGNADPAFQQQLIDDAKTQYQTMGFAALVYLNIRDANITGPDYRLAPSTVFLPAVPPKVELPKEVAKPAEPKKLHGTPVKETGCSSLNTQNIISHQVFLTYPASCPRWTLP